MAALVRRCAAVHPVLQPDTCATCRGFTPRKGAATTTVVPLALGPLVSVPSPPPLALRPKHPRAVVSIVVGLGAYELFKSSGPLMVQYAERVGADLVVLSWPGAPGWPMSAKFQVPRVLDWYDRIAYVDADVLLRPECVNLFDQCGEQEFGACDELPFHRRQPRFGLEANYKDFRLAMGLRDVELPWYLNCGVMVVPKQYQSLLLPPAGPMPSGHCGEQHHTNCRLLDSGADVRLLDRRCNWQSWTDYGFKAAPADAVLHWSGAGLSRQHRAIDMARAAAVYLPVPMVGGPGTELKLLLAAAGFEAGNCSCNAKAAEMDRWGVAGCREHREEVVGWLREEYRKLGWLAKLSAGLRAAAKGLVFDLRDPVGGLVDEAVRRADK